MQRYCEHCRKYVEARRAPFSNLLICSICGSEFGADYLAPGTIVSGFRIEEEIGRGSFGIVYKALQLNLERMVALKILSDELSRDSDFVDNFFREARLAASLSHPNIVQAFDAGATPEGIYYFAMELIEGETLDARIIRTGRLQQSEAISIALKIARAMEYAWERQKLSHGDIKPENIIINSSGEAKLADLGLAKTAHEESSGHLMVTPLYAPPEVISGVQDFDPVRADIYSFGGTFYHMLAGAPPFNEDDPELVMQMHVNDIPISLAERLNVHPDLSFITDRMLAKNPDERPRDWHEIINFLDAVDLNAHRLAKSTRRATLPHFGNLTIPRRKSTLYMLAGLIVALGLTIFAVVLLLIRSGTPRDPVNNPIQVKKQNRDYEWNKLKTDIKFLSERKALELVTKYVETRRDAPQDALQTLEILKKENELAEYRERVSADFDRELREVINLLRNNDPGTASAPVLISLQNRIINLFKLIGENKFLYHRISSHDKRFLDEKVKVLKQTLLRYDQENKRKWISQVDQRKREYREKIQRLDKTLDIINDETDRFFLALAQFNELAGKARGGATALKFFSAVSRKDLPPDLGNVLVFIRDNYKDEQSINTLLVSLKGLLVGSELPDPSPAAGYKITDIDDNFIHVESRLNYGILKKKIRLNGLKLRYRFEILEKNLAIPAIAAKLSRTECFAIIRACLDYRHTENLKEVMTRFYQLSEEDKNQWLELEQILKKSQGEAEAITLWQKAKQESNAGHWPEVNRYVQTLRHDHRGAELLKRIAPGLERLEHQLLILSPDTQALRLLANYLRNKDLPPVKKLSTAMSLRARYGALKSLPLNLRRKLEEIAATVLKTPPAPPEGVTFPEILCAPAHYQPGVCYGLINNYLQTKPDDDSHLKTLLRLTAAIDVGDWQALAETATLPSSQAEVFSSLKQYPPWLAGTVLPVVTALERYGLAALYPQAEKVLTQAMASSNHDAWTRACLLQVQLEHGLQLDGPNTAENFPFQTNLTPAALHLAWLDLLDQLDGNNPDRTSLTNKLKSYQLIFTGNPELKIQVAWLKLAGHLVDGICNPAEIELLKSAGQLNDDLPVRTVSAIAAFALHSGTLTRNNIPPLLQLLEQSLGDNSSYTITWETVLLFKLSQCNTWNDFHDQVDEALGLMTMKSLPVYPKLLMLNLGTQMVSARIDARRAGESLKRFLTGCPLANAEDLSVVDALTAADSRSYLRQLIASRQLRQAYWNGLLLVMGQYYDYQRAAGILDVLKSARADLNWEQLLLLNTLEKLLADTPE